MSADIKAQTPVLPEGVPIERVVPIEKLTGLREQPFADIELHFGVAVDEHGEQWYVIPGLAPLPWTVGDEYRMSNGDSAVWKGTYLVSEVTETTVTGRLESRVPCSVYPWEQCRGHDVGFDGIQDPSRHEGPDFDVATFADEATVYAARIIDGDRRKLSIGVPEITTELDEAALLMFAGECESLARELRAVAAESDGRDARLSRAELESFEDGSDAWLVYPSPDPGLPGSVHATRGDGEWTVYAFVEDAPVDADTAMRFAAALTAAARQCDALNAEESLNPGEATRVLVELRVASIRDQVRTPDSMTEEDQQ